MKTRDIIVVGASAGGVIALKDLVRTLPKDFKGSLFVVLHTPAYGESRLPWILSTAGELQADFAKDGESIERGRIYVAPTDHHLLLEDGRVRVKRGPKENRFRPSIDALFRSAAYVYGERVIGVILSGMLNDGTSGLWSIKQHGGIAIIQSPDDAEQPQMPTNALEFVEPDYEVPVTDMGPLITGMVSEEAPKKHQLSDEQMKLLKMEVVIATRDNAFEMGIMDMGQLTPFTCPECHGALVRLVEGKILRFRCHTGHAYTASSLLSEVSETIEGMLWQSMRGLEEMNMLLQTIGDHYEELKDKSSAKLFREKAKVASDRARNLHDAVFTQEQYSEDIRFNKNNK